MLFIMKDINFVPWSFEIVFITDVKKKSAAKLIFPTYLYCTCIYIVNTEILNLKTMMFLPRHWCFGTLAHFFKYYISSV